MNNRLLKNKSRMIFKIHKFKNHKQSLIFLNKEKQMKKDYMY